MTESSVPGNMWRPEPISAKEADIARATLRVYEQVLKPSPSPKLLEIITRLLIPFGYLPPSAYDKQVLLKQWQFHLQGFPLWVVKQAAEKWQHNQTEKPQIASIVASCKQILYPIKTQQKRIGKIVDAWDNNQFYLYVTEGARVKWEVIDKNGKQLEKP